ncbi:OsmC family protein [Microbaculum marinum]|uniref:OsmC family protein n=1 Tax=Microbaculum marinum TaxID=1764581 RepID=A0AAW9RVZ1_9HYPH
MTVVVNESRKKRARIATATHVAGCRMDLKVRDFAAMAADEPEIAGGTNEGPSPLEYVTAGLAACQLVTVTKIADAMGFAYADLAVDAEADVVFRAARGAMSPIPRFSEARLLVRMRSPETAERIADLEALVEERCPVSNLFLDAGLPPKVDWSIEPIA